MSTYLSIKNANVRDAFISFKEDGHIYTIHGVSGTYESTTTFIHHHFDVFDSKAVLNGMFAKESRLTGVQNPLRLTYNETYMNMTREEIEASWEINRDDSARRGTKMHYDIECYSNGETVTNDSIEFQYFLNFRKDYPDLTPYRTEWMVYYEEYKICGSIDMVYKTPDGSFEIYDWKRSKEIVWTKGNFAKFSHTKEIQHIENVNFWHYSLQLNTYRKILEEKYQIDGTPIRISGMYLVVCHPNASNYQRIAVADVRTEVDALFEARKQKIA